MIHNNTLAALTQRAGSNITQAVKNASHKTGVDFSYLMQQANAESSFNPTAKARTSSASGLYQFIESTWINMVEKHGHKYGIDKNAPRSEILAQRNDPHKAAALAAEFAAENKAHLEKYVGGDIGATEMYFAHFMGASGATGFLNALKENPAQTAADIFPKAARANYNVFYNSKTGEARTLAGVYDFFNKKFGGSNDQTATAPNNTPLRIPQNRGAISYADLLALRPELEGRIAPRNHDSTLWQRLTNADPRQKDHSSNSRNEGTNFFHKLTLNSQPEANISHMQLLLMAQLNK